jgi:type I restriction enzyme S subunit
MSELPTSWAKATVGELFRPVGGGTPSTGMTEFWQGTIPWISSADIDDGPRLSICRFISEEAVRESATNIVPAGSVIVVTRVGLGKVAITDAPLCFSQDNQALLVADELFDKRYVLYYMSTAVREFKHISRGTTISGVTKKQLLETEFVLPPRTEQTRIVAEIEKQFTRLDAATTALKRVQANLKRYRASVLKAACEGRLVPTEAELARKEGRDYEPADKLLQRILRERRSHWETDTLARMIASGKPPKDDRWKEKYKQPVAPILPIFPRYPRAGAGRPSIRSLGASAAEQLRLPAVKLQVIQF